MLPSEPSSKHSSAFGVYIHWPFCVSKCPYCDFNAHVAEKAIDIDQWTHAYIQELHYYRVQTGPRPITSVFFGGGTPSLMPPTLVAKILETLDDLWGFALNPEITLEANPSSAEAAQFVGFAQAGVNRVSLGVQALNDADLRFFERPHSANEAKAAIALAQKHFPRLSFDLIYARPNQSIQAWQEELKQALAFAPEHLSLYQLTIEQGTRFMAMWRRGEFDIPDDDHAAQFYEATRTQLTDHAYKDYEVSNYAQLGAECQHNLIYWRYQDYIGIGPGAHSRYSQQEGGKVASHQHRMPQIWLDRVAILGHATQREQVISPQDRGVEMLMMGVRLSEGIALNRFKAETDQALQSFVNAAALERFIEAGWIKLSPTHMQLTPSGRLRANALLDALMG